MSFAGFAAVSTVVIRMDQVTMREAIATMILAFYKPCFFFAFFNSLISFLRAAMVSLNVAVWAAKAD